MTILATDFEYISDLMRKEAAIVLDPGKEYLVESRLAPILRGEGMSSLTVLIQELRKASSLALKRKVVEALTTNETFFFRDIEPFEALRHEVLPSLIAARASSKRLSIWSAACSTGQEPYSLAMLLDSSFPQLRDWSLQIIGTDLNSVVLEKARSGTYSQFEVNRGLPATHLVKYFRKEGTEWTIKESLRKLVSFQEMNLTHPFKAIPTVDIVLIRNVLIYFDVQTKRDILGRVRKILAPDGALFLGSSETVMNIDENFVRTPYKGISFYKLRGSSA